MTSARLRPPALPWVGYNLLRLTAVIFLIWTLVVQFIALAHDLSEYTASKSLTPSPSILNGAAIANPTNTSSIYEVSSSMSSTITALPPPTSAVTPTTGIQASVIVGVSGFQGAGARRVKRAEVEAADQVGYYGTSSVPNQPGGVVFVLFSRVIIAMTTLVLISAQVGVPESFLYEHGGWLGPQSTPLLMGVLELIVAVENLRVYTKRSNLIPAWTLLGIGLVNSVLGLTLWFMGRRLPKIPPPPLYFSLSQRCLYWTPPPPFYSKILNPTEVDNDPDHPLDPERAEKYLPRSNALEIGLDSDDDGWYDSVEDKSQAKSQPQSQIQMHMQHQPQRQRVREMASEHDVRKGGYPTFSGRGVNEPGRQVPAGTIEAGTNGEVRFTNELQRTQDQTRSRGRPREVDTGRGLAQNDAQNRSKSKAQNRKSRLAPLALPSQILRNPPQRSGSQDPVGSTYPNQSVRQPPSKNTTLPLPPKARQTSALTPIDEDPRTAQSTRNDDYRRSIVTAASDLGPHFPLPPSRSNSADTIMPTKQKRESSMTMMTTMTSLSVDAPYAALAREPSPVKNNPSSTGRKTAGETMLFQPRSPRVEKLQTEYRASSVPSFNAPEPPSAEPSPAPPAVTDALRLRSSPRSRPRSQTMSVSLRDTIMTLRSSLAPSARSPSTQTARIERVAQGVRFDLASPSSVHSSGTVSPSLPARGGIRVPGTSFILPIPGFSAPNTPRPGQRVSLDPMSFSTAADDESTSDSEGDYARPESFASVSTIDSSEEYLRPERPDMPARSSSDDIDPVEGRRGSDDRAGLPRGKRNSVKDSRPKSVMTLGGGYLDGGYELDKQQRRHSSIDRM